MLRFFRTFLTILVTTLGVVVVVAAVLSDPDADFSQRLTMVLLGVVLLEAAAWKRNNPLLPNERRFHDLRAEVDLFVLMVRRLHFAVLNDRAGRPNPKGQARDDVVAEMHAAVERMASVAALEVKD
ncbi:MAG: hypothetical protein RJQ04_04560 [Longimicrobiales bacterium]